MKLVTELEAFEYRGLVSQSFEIKSSVICCWRILNFRMRISECNVDCVYDKRWCLIDKIGREIVGIFIHLFGNLLDYGSTGDLSTNLRGTPL